MNEIYYKQKLSKRDKSGKAPVFLEFNHDAQTLVYATGEKCQVSEWDTEKQKFRRSMPGYQQANESLQLLRERLTTVYRNLLKAGEPVSSEQLRSSLRPNHSPTVAADLPTLYASYLAYCRSSNYKIHSLNSMIVTESRIAKYVATGVKLSVTAYTRTVHAEFQAYLIDELGLHPNSVANSNKHLRAFFNWSKLQGVVLHSNHAHIKTSWVPSERIYLTELELEQLEKAKLSTSLARVRDAFLFQCYTGLRYAELHRLDHSHIEQRVGYKVLNFIPQKSVSARVRKTKRVEVPILPGAETILTRYAGNYRLLPIMSNQKYNDYIKDIAKSVGIDSMVEQVAYEKGTPTLVSIPKYELVSSHIARHTFATLSLSKGVPLEVVSKALGHSDIKTTMIYAKVADEYKNRTILNAWAGSQYFPLTGRAIFITGQTC